MYYNNNLRNFIKKILNEQIVTDFDSKFDYKKDGENYYWKYKTQSSWNLAKGVALKAIKEKVYGDKKEEPKKEEPKKEEPKKEEPKKEDNPDSYDAIFVGGLDGPGYKPISEQLALFKSGYGKLKKVKSFRHFNPVQQIFAILEKNPKIPIFLFSAAYIKAGVLSQSSLVDNSKLYIIEPYTASKNSKDIVELAISNGVPRKNVFKGLSSSTGSNIAGATPSGADDHWGALSSVGSKFS